MNKFMIKLLFLLQGILMLLVIVSLAGLVYAFYSATLWLMILTLFTSIGLYFGFKDLKELKDTLFERKEDE